MDGQSEDGGVMLRVVVAVCWASVGLGWMRWASSVVVAADDVDVGVDVGVGAARAYGA